MRIASFLYISERNKGAPMKNQLTLLAAAIALALGTSVQAADTKQINEQHKADVAKCKDLKGNAKDVCKKEADGKQKVAKAEAELKEHDRRGTISRAFVPACCRLPATALVHSVGTRGRTRTVMAFRPRDFKSLASTSFATRARTAR